MLENLHARLLTPCGLIIMLMIFAFFCPQADAAKVRIKDLCTFQNKQETDLIGYGLVIGLDGSGDGNGTQFTMQSLANMMERMGLQVEPNKLKVKNIAAVMVTARISSDLSEGTYFDVTVSSIGDANSLQGGILLITQLAGPDGVVRAVAQGSVSIGGFNVQVDEGNKIVNNYTLVGRVPNGGKISRPLQTVPGSDKVVLLTLSEPDITTAQRVASRINLEYGDYASPVDGGTIQVTIHDTIAEPTRRMRFLSDLGQLTVEPDQIAKVVINERTGTIVAGQNVIIEPVAIAHGTITVSIDSRPVISQPDGFSKGETVVTKDTEVTVNAEKARVIELESVVKLSDVAAALNKIGATPRDIVAIFQALKQAGALRSELVIM
ncbi:MAG: flagellar basal body P-ring protein FlgI [bacterium]|nr:flagellar basal body P-ring protein FlgI [bacterium]